MAEITVRTARRCELVDISSQVESLIPKGFGDGVCNLFCLHTTAGLTVNENADSSVKADILAHLDRAVPAEHPSYSHSEGNSAAHIKALMTGHCLALPVESGALKLGRWQGVFLCEFDGPRSRTVAASFAESRARA